MIDCTTLIPTVKTSQYLRAQLQLSCSVPVPSHSATAILRPSLSPPMEPPQEDTQKCQPKEDAHPRERVQQQVMTLSRSIADHLVYTIVQVSITSWARPGSVDKFDYIYLYNQRVRGYDGKGGLHCGLSRSTVSMASLFHPYIQHRRWMGISYSFSLPPRKMMSISWQGSR